MVNATALWSDLMDFWKSKIIYTHPENLKETELLWRHEYAVETANEVHCNRVSKVLQCIVQFWLLFQRMKVK